MLSVSFSFIDLVNISYGYNTGVLSHHVLSFLEILHDSSFIPKIVKGL